jgi:hypothetical protein
MIAAGLFMFVLVMGFIVLDWWYLTQRRSDATRYGCRVAAVVQQVPMPSASELAARFHPSGLLPLPHGAARFFPNERRMVLHPDCRRFASRFRTAWPMKGSIDVSSAEDGLQLVCIKRIPWSSAIVTLLWFALVGLGTTGFVISFLLQGGFESLSGIVMGLGVMGLGALVFIFGLVTVSLAYHLENTRLMQVWEELRQALRGPATEDETGLV